MVWFKGWLETKSRVAFTLVWSAFFIGVMAMAVSSRGGGPAPAGVDPTLSTLTMLAFPWIFVPVWLAGSGVRTQPGFGRQATRGLHGSTYFTLSLPVTRARLLLVRGAVGLLETAAVVALLGIAAWLVLPVLRMNATPLAGLQHLMVVFVCGTAIYGLSTLAATLLDDTLYMWGSTLAVMVLWAQPVRRLLPPALDIFRPLTEASPIVTHTLPWATMAVALVTGGVFVLAALKVVQAREY